MRPATRLIVLFTALAIVSRHAAPAMAWHNGVGRGAGFGTHDWVLYEANQLARAQGYAWVNTAVAQQACDDPDTVLGDFEHHTYDVWGTPEGDAPAYIAGLYNRAVAERAAGEFDAASETVGLIAHYVADACDPLHTDASAAEDSMGVAYETAANAYTDAPGDNRYWLSRVRVNYVYNVEARVLEAATAAHSDYATLVGRYATTGMDATALKAVRSALVRATDLMADIIASIDADARDEGPHASVRLSGLDRWSTATAISGHFTSAESTTVVIASGRSFPDALAGAPLAAALDAPILLTSATELPPATIAELERLRPDRVVVLGGTAAVSASVVDQLAALSGVTTVTRLAGADRYGTARAVSAELLRIGLSPDTVFIATGANFPDALSAAPVAAYAGYPVLLTRRDALPAETISALSAIAPSNAFILGGIGAVGMGVEAQLNDMGIATSRLAGATRYDTSAAINGLAESLGMSFEHPGLANGTSFPDALAGGPALGSTGSPLLLTAPVRLPSATAGVIEAHASEIATLTVLGGEAAVSELVLFDVQSLFDDDPPPASATPEWQACGFVEGAAYAHAAALAALGPRPAGSLAEHRAFDYIAAQLRSYGYAVSTQTFLLPNGAYTHNVFADKAGSEPRFLVLGAHVDTKSPSPGANDNGSGVGTVLELARAFSQTDTTPSLRFIFFGAEEMLDPDPSHHHYGSGHYVTTLTAAQKAEISGMVSVDMVGYGNAYHARTMLVGPQSMSALSLSVAAREGIPITFLKDFGTYGWSDHEPFERNGIPAVWLEWREDPVYHTTGDVASHLDLRCIKTAGDHLVGMVLGLSAAEMP